MPTRSLRRNSAVQGFAKDNVAPIYVDSDDNIIKFIPAGSGTTEVQVVDSTSTQTISGDKTFTGTCTFTSEVTTAETFANGSVSAPSIAFTNSATTGWYRIGADNVGMAIAGVKTFDFSATGLTLPKTATKGIRIADWVGSGASGSAVPFSSVQNIYSDGQLDILGAYGESTTDMTSAFSAKVGRFRHVVSTASTATIAHEVYGLVGQLVTKDTTLTHLGAGLMGTFEGNTTGSVLNSSYTTGGHGAVIARVGGHNKITATTPLAGFLAFNNQSAALTGGSIYGFSTSMASASYPWTIGFFAPVGSAKCGVQVGAFASSYATGSALLMNATDTAAARFYGETTSDLTSAVNCRTLMARHLVVTSSATINHESYGMIGQLCVKNTTLGHLHAGVMGTFEVSTAATVNGAYTYGAAAVIGRLGVGTSITTATKAVAAFAAVYNGGALVSGDSVAFAATSTTATTFSHFLAVDKCDNILYAATGTNYESGIKITAITNVSTTASGVMRLKVGSTLYYVPLWAAAQLDGE